MHKTRLDSPQVLVLGGRENGLAIVRSFERRGIPVWVSATSGCPALQSRFCRTRPRYKIPTRQTDKQKFWEDLLLGSDAAELRGSVLFPCSDAALTFEAEHKAELGKSYVLQDFCADQRLAMLDKQKTIELARAAGIPAPRFWPVSSVADLEGVYDEVTYPVIIKPIHSHLFMKVFREKLFIVHRAEELERRAGDVVEAGLDFMICEMIPGPDSNLSSYYTYIDASGNRLFRFTKKVIRRFPITHGGGCCHATEWIAETAELGEKLFEGINFRGLGNVEFKLDERDGQLKVIEVNSRVTSAHELLVRCGMDIAYLIYCHLTGQPVPNVESYQEDLRLWYPVRDLKALLELRRRGEISVPEWLRSVAHRPVLPFFQLADPWPSLAQGIRRFWK